MEILKSQYKKILIKLDLSRVQLISLQNRLQSRYICTGPFVKEQKMCPNTTALALKINEQEMSGPVVRRLLNSYGITNYQLILFYLLFDLPAMISGRFFEKSLKELQSVTTELIERKK